MVSSSSGPERFLGRSFTALMHGREASRVTVEQAWSHQGRLILKFSGIDSITAAESLRGCDLAIPSTDREPPAPGEFYLADLIGCTLIEARTGRPVGVVEGWRQTGGPVLLELRGPEGKELLVPFAASICKSIDLAARRILAELPEGLAELNG